MTERRTGGEGAIYWHEKRQRWIAVVTAGYDGRGKRVVRSASGRTRTEAKTKLRALKEDQADGITAAKSAITVRQAVDDWLTYGLPRRSKATVEKYKIMAAKHIYRPLGARKLRDLSAAEVDRWLTRLAPALSTRTARELRSILSRAVDRAMARDLVRRNVVDLAELPQGRDGRRSKSLTAEQVDAVLTSTAPDRLHPYIVVALLTGARTEELRALRWDHVHLEPASGLPHLEVWRSVRKGGDTKTRKSRRTLALPSRCIEALRKQRAQQAADRLAADDWQDSGLVFTTAVGTPMDAANVRLISAARSVSIRGSGPLASCGTRSSPCCPMPAFLSSRSRTRRPVEPPSPSWSTGTSCALSFRPARPSWIACLRPNRGQRSQADSQAVGPAIPGR